MANTDAQYLEALRTARDEIVARGSSRVRIDTGNGLRELEFLTLKEVNEEIDRVERKIAAAARGAFGVGVLRGAGA